jgi:hypothetical protein
VQNEKSPQDFFFSTEDTPLLAAGFFITPVISVQPQGADYTALDSPAPLTVTASAVAAITFASLPPVNLDAIALAAALNAISAGSAEAAGTWGTADLLTNGRIKVNSTAVAAKINGTGVIHLKSQGNLIYIETGEKLILDGTVILDGLITAPTVSLAGITTLPLGFEDAINNTQHLIFVQFGGIFTMNGGVIKDNHANLGGGVRLYGGATFIMAGGTIYGSSAVSGANTATSQGAALCAIFGTAMWGDNSTITNKSNQNGTISGGSPGSP